MPGDPPRPVAQGLVILIAFLYTPIVLLVLFSFNEPRTPGLPIPG